MNESQHSADLTGLPLSGREDVLEINQRQDSDNQIVEFWIPSENRIEINVIPAGIDSSPFGFEVEPSQARDAFDHPYAYAAQLMVEEAFRVAA